MLQHTVSTTDPVQAEVAAREKDSGAEVRGKDSLVVTQHLPVEASFGRLYHLKRKQIPCGGKLYFALCMTCG